MTTPLWRLAMVTAHRPQHLVPDSVPWIGDQLARVMVKLRDEHGTQTTVSGMALGGDLLWARTAEREGMPLWAHVPFPQQPDVWPWPDLVADYRRLVAYADRTGGVKTYGDLGDLPDGAERKALATQLLHDRNTGMIRETTLARGVVVAVLRSTRTRGGTWSAYNKAKDDAQLPIIRLDPDARTVTLASAGRDIETTETHEQEKLPI